MRKYLIVINTSTMAFTLGAHGAETIYVGGSGEPFVGIVR